MDGASMQGDTMKRIGATMLREIREAVPATIFFLWLFHMIALTKAVTLGDYSITALRATVATVGALIVAKAILIVEALPISRIFSRQLWFHVLWKTLLFNVVVLIFRFIEEIIHLTRKHGDLSTAVAQLFREIAWPQFAVFQLWLFFGLFLYCVIAEIVRVVGVEKVKAMFSGSAGKRSHG
jgi:hypothetical protein